MNATVTNDLCVATRDLGKRFGDRDALLEVNMEIPRGRCCGIFGANGSGKTTLLKIISTLILPTSGEVTVGDCPLPAQANGVRGRLSVLLDRPFIPRDFTLQEGLHYFADLHHVDVSNIEEVAKRVGLSWRLRDPIRTFSRGMGQRVSLACCLLADREILILDEPFTGLDRAGCELVEEVVLECTSSGKTVLLVTHEIDRGVRLSDQIVVLRRGRVVLDRGPGEWGSDDLLEAIR